ncbi:hypothetical protein CVT25_015355 [Psilocybe cyanescens]|uniref:Uncharacterized protein n=1 Tax=Psilocybe cyanescens TaxID=93625 RepID=A0A409WH71_PSICY|nr:hypothetical protein CVT25_015355 [Psilocybe cyanescens]
MPSLALSLLPSSDPRVRVRFWQGRDQHFRTETEVVAFSKRQCQRRPKSRSRASRIEHLVSTREQGPANTEKMQTPFNAR